MPQLQLSFRETLVRALYAAGAPDLGLLPPSPSSRSVSSSSSGSDGEDAGGGEDGSSQSSDRQSFSRGRKRKRRRRPEFNTVLKARVWDYSKSYGHKANHRALVDHAQIDNRDATEAELDQVVCTSPYFKLDHQHHGEFQPAGSAR